MYKNVLLEIPPIIRELLYIFEELVSIDEEDKKHLIELLIYESYGLTFGKEPENLSDIILNEFFLKDRGILEEDEEDSLLSILGSIEVDVYNNLFELLIDIIKLEYQKFYTFDILNITDTFFILEIRSNYGNNSDPTTTSY